MSFQPQFVLQGEISCIYKKDNTTRKNHQLIYIPDIETAKKINAKLARIGNLNADGRPMLGLDAKILLEYALEEKHSYLIPAHIWTPWFSIFGSKSGFNTLEECFEDLTEEIFALETGLSSDPPMNRLCSALDRYVLISNSDAHSGENLGREVNIFHAVPTYQSLFESLRRKNAFFLRHSGILSGRRQILCGRTQKLRHLFSAGRKRKTQKYLPCLRKASDYRRIEQGYGISGQKNTLDCQRTI